jgi:transglutaminase-like putative cysteine protease
MRYRITHTTSYTYTEPVPLCQNKAHLHPRNTQRQSCSGYQLLVTPDPVSIECRHDYFGNHVDYFSLHVPHRALSVKAVSTIDVAESAPASLEAPAWETVRDQLHAPHTDNMLQVCLFRFASEFVRPLEPFARYAQQSFTPGRSILEAARELTHRIYDEFKYDPRATTVSTPVAEVFEKKAGVCQDFAHFQISCLRALGLAARYVSGYLRTVPPPGKPRLEGADASHAWLSVYCGELGWVDFDPTNDVIPGTDHVSLAHGRDYGDVCPLQGIFLGGGDHTMTVAVNVEPLDEAGP